MVTGIAYEEVPNFVEVRPSSWTTALREWLAEHGLGFVRVGVDAAEAPHVPIIAIGRSRAGCFYAIVISDKVYDPDTHAIGPLEPPKHRLAILPFSLVPGAS